MKYNDNNHILYLTGGKIFKKIEEERQRLKNSQKNTIKEQEEEIEPNLLNASNQANSSTYIDNLFRLIPEFNEANDLYGNEEEVNSRKSSSESNQKEMSKEEQKMIFEIFTLFI